ncbi:MAG: DUF1549 domain-containing protein, partial [Rubripirellula sp.]|nr:DUF1549 domain-containing protein [Rubripirellula sp.]
MTQPTWTKMRFELRITVLLVIASWAFAPLQLQAVDFDKQIAPILASHCLECHRGDEPEGGLDLTELDLVKKGGDSGPAVLLGNGTDSLLWERVSTDEMPPKHPLTKAEKQALKRWIDEGAKWGNAPLDLFSTTTDIRAGRDWWSLQPLRNVKPPTAPSDWGRNEIDNFVYQKLVASKLSPSPEADKRVLIRRLSYDLIGLPPTPQQIDAFMKDESDGAYETLVNQLLASPHYGERWGRHWLDVVHFGESNGFEYNQPRNNAWPYRNWVVDALNDNMPYDEFVRHQIAGDILAPHAGGTIAVGCLVTGPHNTTKPSNDTMRSTMRQDEMEDLVGMVNQTFLGMTTNCARCHDHKFDPISIEDYYSMASALAGVEFGEREVQLDTEAAAKATQAKTLIKTLSSELTALESRAREDAARSLEAESTSGPDLMPLAAWNFDEDLKDHVGTLDVSLVGAAKRGANGLILDGKNAFARTKPLAKPLAAKTLEAWVQLADLNQRGG